MASAFSMLSMLSKARRSGAKSTNTPATATTPLPALTSTESTPSVPATIAGSDLSDSASIISKESTKKKLWRRSSAKRTGTSHDGGSSAATPPTGTTLLPTPTPTEPKATVAASITDSDLSDSASIISKTSTKKKRSPSSLLRGLTRRSSVASIAPVNVSTSPGAPSVLSPILASPIDVTPFTNGPESTEGQQQDLKKRISSDGFSVVSHNDDEQKTTTQRGQGPAETDPNEGDWTEVVAAFPSPPPSLPSPPSISTTGFNDERTPLSFNDAEELTSSDEEIKKANEKLRVLEAKLSEREKEKKRMEDGVQASAGEKQQLESMVRDVEQKLKETEMMRNEEVSERERLEAELKRANEDRGAVENEAQVVGDKLKDVEERHAKQEAEIGRLQAELDAMKDEKDRLAGRVRADAEALKDTKARYARQELEKGGLKAELQAISREKEAASLKVHAITQQWEDMRRDWKEECAKSEHLEEKLRVMTAEKEQLALDAKDLGDELDHLYQRYAEQDDEVHRLKDDLQKATSIAEGLVKAARDAKRDVEELKGKGNDMEMKWEKERARMAEGHEEETKKLKADMSQQAVELANLKNELENVRDVRDGQMETLKCVNADLQKTASIAEGLAKAVLDSKREEGKLKEKIGDMERKWEAERNRLAQVHEGEMATLKEEMSKKAVELERTWAASKLRMLDEHSDEVGKLKEQMRAATRELQMQVSNVVDGHAAERKKWVGENQHLKAQWEEERSGWEREREQNSKELYRLAQELNNEKRDGGYAVKVATTMEGKLKGARDELAKANEELKRREGRILELEGEVKSLRDLDTRNHDTMRWEVKARDLSREVTRLCKDIERMSRSTENGRLDRVLEDQAKRQSSDIRFSRMSASRPGSAETIEPVDAAVSVLYVLNNEIFQAAASLADIVEADTSYDGLDLDDFDGLVKKVAPFLSEELVVSLRSAYTGSSDGPNPLILQVAFQACLAYCCNRFITSWYPLHWDYSQFLEVLHGRLVEAGTLPEADSWRSTTKALLRLTSESQSQMVSYLQDSVLDIFAIIGRSTSSRATGELMTRFKEKFSVLARLAIRMHILFNDAPSNLKTFLAQPGMNFSFDTMEDTYADDEDTDPYSVEANLKNVICTAELGLRRVSVNNSTDDGMIMKPKVILAALLNQEW